MHFKDLVEFDRFTMSILAVVCTYRELDYDSFILEYNYSDSKRLGLYIFPNRIVLYYNTLNNIGVSIDDNKTYILYTITHELFHATQNIVQGTSMEIEKAADLETKKFLSEYGNQIGDLFNFVYKEDIVDTMISQYTDNISNVYIPWSIEYFYIQTVLSMARRHKPVSSNFCTELNNLIYNSSNEVVFFIVDNGSILKSVCIKYNNSFLSYELFIQFCTGVFSYNYSNVDRVVIDKGNIIVYIQPTIRPIKEV